MSDAKPNATYSHGSAPVSNFQVVYRSPDPKPSREEKSFANTWRRLSGRVRQRRTKMADSLDTAWLDESGAVTWEVFKAWRTA